MVTLARNFYFLGARVFTGLTAVLFARLREAPAWEVSTLLLFFHHGHGFPLICGSICVASELVNRKYRPLDSGKLIRIDRLAKTEAPR